jgi:ABC-type multidrug transport system fused ATPase/permease subunit
MSLVATDYPLLNLFWTMVELFFFVVWIWVLISVLIDIFRSHDLSGWAKALWLILVVFLPLIGVLAYVIARGEKMHEHALRNARAQEAAMTAYVRDAAGTTSTADELTKLAGLRDQGVLTQDQFEAQKAKLLT